jgi:hypothetical protein
MLTASGQGRDAGELCPRRPEAREHRGDEPRARPARHRIRAGRPWGMVLVLRRASLASPLDLRAALSRFDPDGLQLGSLPPPVQSRQPHRPAAPHRAQQRLGIYLVTRKRRGGDVLRLFRGSTPMAVLFSSLTAIVSLGTLALARHPEMAYMGNYGELDHAGAELRGAVFDRAVAGAHGGGGSQARGVGLKRCPHTRNTVAWNHLIFLIHKLTGGSLPAAL